MPLREPFGRVGREGWVALSKDDAIRHTPNEIAALIAARTAIFIIAAKDITGAQQASALQTALPAIRVAARRPLAIIGRVNKEGAVSIMWEGGLRLHKPRVVRVGAPRR